MDSRHATLGRRTLEEIRQKRAAERLTKTSSGPDLSKPPIDVVEIKRSGSANRLSENDISGIVSQLQDMQQRNAELEETNRRLTSMLQLKEDDNGVLQKRLNDLEQNTVPSLRKALKDVAMEKDAAVVSREDLLAQIRSLKKQMKEAEEEQYRAEEDAAALRAELNSLQQQAIGGIASTGYSADQMRALEQDVSNLRSQLEQESMLKQQEHHLLEEERARTSFLVIEKQDLEERLASISEKSTEEAEKGNNGAFTPEERERLEKQLHNLAVAVERLESSRQKLLLEIDSQSSEIEKLFEENSNLSLAYQESEGLVAHWENQVKDCLRKNEELRGALDRLRTEQANTPVLDNTVTQMSLKDSSRGGNLDEHHHTAELYALKGQLASEQSRAEALSAEVLQLSARLQQAKQAYNGLARIYKPVLRNIETSLMKMKQDGSVYVQ